MKANGWGFASSAAIKSLYVRRRPTTPQITALNRSASFMSLPVVEAERLLVEVAEQVERLDAHVRALSARFSSDQKFSSPFVWTCPST